MKIFISFSEDKIMEIYMGDKYALSVVRYDFRYSGYYWNHLIGNLYFSSDSLLSLKTVDKGANPATIILGYISGGAFNGWGGQIRVQELDIIFGTTTQLNAFFYSDHVLFDGVIYEKVEEVDAAIEVVADAFIPSRKDKKPPPGLAHPGAA